MRSMVEGYQHSRMHAGYRAAPDPLIPLHRTACGPPPPVGEDFVSGQSWRR
jgi:hypothetical protein